MITAVRVFGPSLALFLFEVTPSTQLNLLPGKMFFCPLETNEKLTNFPTPTKEGSFPRVDGSPDEKEASE